MASKAATSAAVSAQLTESAEIPASEYRYQVEIAQMVSRLVQYWPHPNVLTSLPVLADRCAPMQQMFVFGDVVDPHPDVTKLVEDIVRNQVIEMVSIL